MTTSTCSPVSKARYSAVASAMRGASSRSMVGSPAWFRNSTVRSSAPLRANRSTKVWVSRAVIPIPANTTANGSPRGARACSTIEAASSSPGSPGPENTGSFCPRTRVFIPSMALMPVSMNSLGRSRRAGFIGAPYSGRSASPTGAGSPSSGRPAPESERPINSRPTTARATWPVKVTVALPGASPSVSSRIWITVSASPASITCPRRSGAPGSRTVTHSPIATRTVRSRKSSGPAAPSAP